MRALIFLFLSLNGWTAEYYVDSRRGDDAQTGISASQAWRTLAKVNGFKFQPGDRILLKSGSFWQEQLAPASSGTPDAPTVIDRYGNGAYPRIDGNGKFADAVRLYNVEGIEVRHLEVTNHGDTPAARRGVHIFLDNFGTARHIVVSGLYIHNVNGTNSQKDNGGIIFRTNGNTKSSRFDGLTIERNILRNVDRSAIAAQSYHFSRARWFPSLRVIIRDNLVDDIGGDGIVPWATDGVLVEHNIARNCNMRANTYNAGIWPWSADNSVFRWNSASFTRTTMDGQGFDSDYNSRNTLFEYNYSHDNEGGFMLICTPGKRNPKDNIGNIGTIARYNISRNDGERIFHLSAAEKTVVHDNAIYVPEGREVQMLVVTNWDGWADDAVFRSNRLYVSGTARYGHEVRRMKDGRYEMEPGWGPARNIRFEGNEYYGKHVDRPADATGTARDASQEPRRDWREPVFDSSSPEGFDAFIEEHRAWIRRLFEAEFGRAG
jgi:hypothetical protein